VTVADRARDRYTDCVLLVEDDNDSRLIYRTFLSQAGLEVVTVGDGAAVLRVANIVGPSVILLDIGLPNLDGIQVLKRIRNDPRLRATPVIAITGRAMTHEQYNLRDAGFDAVLLKPIEPSAVLGAIQQHLDVQRSTRGEDYLTDQSAES